MAGGAPREAIMLERFTERARRVVVLATEEARSRRHDAVGPEHLLMGILRDGGLAVRMLERLRVSTETLRAEVERVLSETPESATSGDPAFSPELKAVLEAALEIQRQRVGIERLLLGLLADDRSAASQILRAAGADLDEARRTTLLLDRLGLDRPITEENVRFIATSKWRVRL